MAQFTMPCAVLPADSPCGAAYAGYPVLDMPRLYAAVNDISHPTADWFADRYKCIASPVLEDAIRYQVSLTCATMVLATIMSHPPCLSKNMLPYGPLLCQQEMRLAYHSFIGMVMTPDACAAPDLEQKDSAAGQAIAVVRYWAQLDIERVEDGNNGQCSPGTISEQQYCGFATLEDAKMLCPTADDPCCIDFVKNAGRRKGFIYMWGMSPSLVFNEISSRLPIGIVGVVSASLAVALMFFGCVFRQYRVCKDLRGRRNHKGQQEATLPKA